MKGPVQFLLVATLLLPAVACSNVDSVNMLGTPLADQEAAEFAGVWLHNDETPVYVVHRGGPAVHFAIVGQEKGELKMHEFDAVLTRDDGTVYMNFEKKPDEGDGPVTYQFLRLTKIDDDTYYAHPANDDGFAAAVEGGQLSGQIERREGSYLNREQRIIHVDASAQELADFVQPDKASEQFNLESPMYLHRLTKYD